MKFTNRVLIIGQAPPAVNQCVPYDTTMLYEMLEWVNITKEDAQDIFEFDAVYNKFPGYGPNKEHLKPSQKQMEEYWITTLSSKVYKYEKILILGNVAKDFINPFEEVYPSKRFVYLTHPSRLNYNRIMNNKKEITEKLNNLIYT